MQGIVIWPNLWRPEYHSRNFFLISVSKPPCHFWPIIRKCIWVIEEPKKVKREKLRAVCLVIAFWEDQHIGSQLTLCTWSHSRLKTCDQCSSFEVFLTMKVFQWLRGLLLVIFSKLTTNYPYLKGNHLYQAT